jgi:hypothetical protein
MFAQRKNCCAIAQVGTQFIYDTRYPHFPFACEELRATGAVMAGLARIVMVTGEPSERHCADLLDIPPRGSWKSLIVSSEGLNCESIMELEKLIGRTQE